MLRAVVHGSASSSPGTGFIALGPSPRASAGSCNASMFGKSFNIGGSGIGSPGAGFLGMPGASGSINGLYGTSSAPTFGIG